SRMSSRRPSSIFFGMNGSAIEGRAAPIRSRMPDFTCRTMASGEVKRPTATTGLVVSALTPFTYSSRQPSPAQRQVPQVGLFRQHADDVADLGVGDAAIA